METDIHTVGKLQTNESALTIKYIKILKRFLLTVGAWPGEEFGEKMHWFSTFFKYFLPCFTASFLLGEIYFMCVEDLDFMALGHDLLNFFLTSLAIMRELLPWFKEYRRIVREFLLSFHLVHFKHKGTHWEQVYKSEEKFSYYFTVYTAASLLFGSIMFNMSPFYTNYQNGAFSGEKPVNVSYDFSIFYSFPFFDPANHFGFISAVNVYMSYNCAVVVCVVDLLLSLMVFHIIGHIIILRKNLEHIEASQDMKNIESSHHSNKIEVYAVKYSKHENEKIKEVLTDCVKHHRLIVRFTGGLSEFFGPVLAFNYTFHLVSLCMLLLESTAGDLNAVIRFGPLTIIIFGELIQISVIFEVVGTVSEKLPDALYACPWERMDVRNRRSVCILLQRLQRPIHVTAMGMTAVGVTTMAGILKTTFSYFAFLRSINTGE